MPPARYSRCLQYSSLNLIIKHSLAMNHEGLLLAGLANIGDGVRVIDREGSDLGVMVVAKARKIAPDQDAELFVVAHSARPPVVRVVMVRKARPCCRS